ncbi:MAG TPA: PKD domain-containing protein [Chitinophagaceae bacterium]|nr:PKD domain-containing protein [Chitinophagaceae bacterium]
MKGFKCIVWLFVFVFWFKQSNAQSYLHFIENKGQWNSKVAFKGELPAGAFFLRPDGGYKMVLHNLDDLKNITEQNHTSSSVKPSVQSLSVTNTSGQKVLHSHAYEVKFLNANPQPQIIKEKPLANYNNYFIGNNPAKWAGGCKIYQSITYKNIYPNIDVRYYTSSQGKLKYDIIVYPGGDIKNVSLYYDGVDGLKLKDGALKIKTSIEDVVEGNPVSYISNQSGRKEIFCNYKIAGNIMRFDLKESKPRNSILVIDPTIIFASFSGSNADNWGYTATYDNAGNFYAGGIVFATGYPVTNNAFQTKFAGGNNNTGEGDPQSNTDMNGFDIGIMKFNSTGTSVMYATYIGGATGNEQPHSLVADNNGNLVIAGRTTSSDYPTIFPDSVGPCGKQDIILTKLNATGTALIGSLRIGGKGDDGVNISSKDIVTPKGSVLTRRNYGDDARSEVILDNAGNIYLASCTQSSDFPTTNPFQLKNSGGTYNQDGVIIKAAPDLSSIIFSSYLGGTGDDAAFALAINPVSNNIYVCGATASKDLSNKSINTYNGGICDGFISIISNTANPLLLSNSYIGTASADQLYGIQFNKAGEVFVTGTTEGVIPVVNSPFNVTSQSNGKQFITKLSSDLLTVIYSANFGSGGTYPNISPAAFLVDNCENVYVSGWGGGLDGPYTNSGTSGLTPKSAPDGTQPLKTTTDGNSFYFFVLERNANSQLYGGFYGDNKMNPNLPNPPPGDYNGVHVDGGTSRFDNKGVVYQSICACGPDPGMSTFGVVYPNNGAYMAHNGYSCNLFALKVAFNLAGVLSGVQASINGVARDTAGCVPLQVNFTDTIGTAKQYIWNFGDGGADTTTNTSSISHNYNSSGNFLVRLIGVDNSKCFPYDTSYVTIKVGTDSVSLGLTYSRVGGCNSLTYLFKNKSIPSPTAVPFKSNSFKINFGDGSSSLFSDTITHTYPSVGTYNVSLVLVDSNYCNQYDSTVIQLRISNNVKAQFTTPAFGCAPYNAVFTNTSLGGTSFEWVFGDGSTYTTTSIAAVTHLYSNIQTYSAYLIATDTNTCNKVDTSAAFLITVQGKPTANFTASPQPPVSNTPVVFTNNSVGAVSYKWIFGDGTDSVTASNAPVSHLYNATGTYTVSLIAFNNAGCSDTLSLSVAALITPLFGIPTAIAPNCNCSNNKIFIRGFGIATVKWNIYNRWGTLVFSTENKDQSWDGKYKGVVLPQDAYKYFLDIKMTDGKSYQTSGDITLLK